LRYIKQFGIILLISFIGEILHALIPLPIPASIYGIVMLFAALELKLIPLSSVKEASAFLIEIMPVMFIPAAVGLMNSWDILRPAWLQYLIITVITTVVVMVISGRITQALICRSKKKGRKEYE
jgi:holin-like protein